MYLVTGASGNVGNEVVNQLLDSGRKVRVFARDLGKVTHWGDRVQVAIGDYGKPDTFAPALSGIEGVFLMNRGPDPETFRKFLDSARAQGSPRIVFLSSIVATDPEQQSASCTKTRKMRSANPVCRGSLSVPAASCRTPFSGSVLLSRSRSFTTQPALAKALLSRHRTSLR